MTPNIDNIQPSLMISYFLYNYNNCQRYFATILRLFSSPTLTDSAKQLSALRLRQGFKLRIISLILQIPNNDDDPQRIES